MEKNKKILIFLLVIKLSFSIVPLWNFTSSAIDLLKDKKYSDYYIVDRELHSVYFKLLRKLYFDDNNIIKEENIIKLGINKDNIEDYGKTEFDDIETVYKDNNNNFIVCPKGPFHPYVYMKENKNYYKYTPNDINEEIDWDLKCYYQYNENMLFVSYLNSHNKFYFFDINNEKKFIGNNIYGGIYGFKWKTSNYDKDKVEKEMFSIICEGNRLYLKDIHIYISNEHNSFGYYQANNHDLVALKSKYLGFFRNDTFNFSFINYNDKNASDFESGYYFSKTQDITHDNMGSIEIHSNYNSPFEDFEDFIVNKLKYIYETQYVYYNISNINENKYYYGIIDINLNKVVFNTNEDLLVFKPYSHNAMLAITSKSAYKICIIRKNNDNDCLDTCNNNDLILDSTTYNSCGKDCKSNIFLMPNKICINDCDKNIFILKENKECWLCKDIDNGVNKYKFINGNHCLKEKPNNSYFVNKQFYVIDCIEGYYYNNDECIKCHDNCKKCTGTSNNNTDQKCISCKNEVYFLEYQNCVENCSNGFYPEDKNCKKCNDKCKTCNINENNCTSCDSGKYLDNNSCEKCSENCGNCSDFNTCLTCNKTSNFTYLYNNTCLSDCPEDTTIKTIGNNQVCIAKSDNNDKKNENENGDLDKKVKTMQFIFIIVTGLLLFIIIICFCKSICCKSKKNKENLINEINTELIDNDNIIN